MTSAGSKRAAASQPPESAALLLQQHASGASFARVIGDKLQSQQAEEIISGCGLLAALDLPLKQILAADGAPPLLPLLLAHIASSPDTDIAAEAASVLRAWSVDVEKVRLLYAYCIFPKILALLPGALQRLGGISQLSAEQLPNFEHWLASVLLFCWAVVEEIPASLRQVNESALVEVATKILQDGQKWWSQETLLILLRMLLCVTEDNPGLLSQVQAVRLENILQQGYGDPASGAPLHLRILATGLAANLREEAADGQLIDFFVGCLQQVAQLDDASLELLLDLLELLANRLSEEPHFDQPSPSPSTCWQSLCQRFGAAVSEETQLPRWINCQQRILSCLVNLAPWSSLSDAEKQSLWVWTLSDALPLVMASADSQAALLAPCGQLLRVLLLQSLEKYALPYTPQDDQRLRALCVESINDDSVISSLLPVVALLNARTGRIDDAVWFAPFVKSLFVEARAGGVILAVAEVVEELSTAGAIDADLAHHLDAHRRAVYRACQRSKMEDDELDYIVSTIDRALDMISS